jgi:hypothetical protein
MKAYRQGKLMSNAKVAYELRLRFILMNALAYTKILAVVVAERLWRAPSRTGPRTASGRREDGRART